MSKDKTYCDDCGEEIKGKDFVSISHLPFSIASANEGESAILCKECIWKDGRLGKLIAKPLPPRVHVAMWNHRHGTDAIVGATEEGVRKAVAHEVVLAWIDELDDEKDIERIKKLIADGKYKEAISVWGDKQVDGRGEWVEITSTEVGA